MEKCNEIGWIDAGALDGLEMAYLSEGLETGSGTGVSAYYTPSMEMGTSINI